MSQHTRTHISWLIPDTRTRTCMSVRVRVRACDKWVVVLTLLSWASPTGYPHWLSTTFILIYPSRDDHKNSYKEIKTISNLLSCHHVFAERMTFKLSIELVTLDSLLHWPVGSNQPSFFGRYLALLVSSPRWRSIDWQVVRLTGLVHKLTILLLKYNIFT